MVGLSMVDFYKYFSYIAFFFRVTPDLYSLGGALIFQGRLVF